MSLSQQVSEFNVTPTKSKYNDAEDDYDEIDLLAVPNFEEHGVKNIMDIQDTLLKIKNDKLIVVNDFDVPWICLNKIKFPKVPKKKTRKKKDSDSDDSDEDKSDTETEEEEESEEEEQEEN